MDFIGTDVPGHEITGSADGLAFILTCSCGDWTMRVETGFVSIPNEPQDGESIPAGPDIVTALQRLADAGLEHILRATGKWPEP